MLPQTQRLLDIMAQLRHPDTGCEWDLKQTFASLVPYTLEEAYEVVDAIERNDLDDLKSELGDLLLQVVFHARLADELGEFSFDDVAATISDKLIHRHPHVFGDANFANDEERHQAWEAAKEIERKAKKNTEQTASILDGIAAALPALLHCEKTMTRASLHGFDWTSAEPVFDKVQEELDEVKEAWQSGDQAHIEEELGDLLLVSVNLARHLNVTPETALKAATRKFSRRFQYIEQQVAASGRAVKECELQELDALWDEAKIKLKSSIHNNGKT